MIPVRIKNSTGEQEDRGHGECHRHPVRQRQGDGAKDVGVDVEHEHDQPDVALAFLVGLAEMLTIKQREPGAEHDEPGGERNEMRRIEHVKDAAGGGEHRKGANAARALGVAVSEKVLEGEAEKQAQAEQEPYTRQ
jgi:hypothetical protein